MQSVDEAMPGVRAVIAEVLELETEQVQPQSYVFRDLGAESIDLLEFGIGLSRLFGFRVQDGEAFLKDFRLHAAQANGTTDGLGVIYPHLEAQRLEELLHAVAERPNARPLLQVRDIAAYIVHRTARAA